MKRSVFAFGLIAAVLVAGGCSGGQVGNDLNATTKSNTNISNSNLSVSNATTDRGEYPAGVEEQFLKSCEESGSKPDFCACMFEKVQRRYTFEEFSEIETKITAGEPPKDFVEFTGQARAACMKSLSR